MTVSVRMSVCLCMCVFVSEHTSRNTRWPWLGPASQVIGCEDRLRNDLYCVGWGVKLKPNQSSVLLWRCRDTLGTSGFIHDVMLAHKLRQLNVAAQLIKAQPTFSLGLGYKQRVGIPVAGQWTHTYGPTYRAPRSGHTRPQCAC